MRRRRWRRSRRARSHALEDSGAARCAAVAGRRSSRHLKVSALDMPAAIPKLSVVIPVYNEEQVLPTLFARLYPALDALGIGYECVFVNDGSKDRSAALLRQQFQQRPRETRVVLFHANFGQHSAVMAGLAYARGEYVITLDADLQNPPEEIHKLVEKLDQGYDYVGTIRQQRQDR